MGPWAPNPIQKAACHQRECDKELDRWALNKVGHDAAPVHPAAIMRGANDPGSPFGAARSRAGSLAGSLGGSQAGPSPSSFRLPLEGDPVQIFGLHARAELNGLRARVASGGLDPGGKVAIRLSDVRGTRKMMIRPENLAPLLGTSAPALQGAGAGRIGRTPALSAESCPPSRASGSVFSMSARSALCNTGRVASMPALPSAPPTPVP
mmetsp:Transcript_41527/g.109582  ORF Transcript_41527/g.109582 Transcript_41527/m.109582 type:complete len:208 (-) Transcript_41527:145-768(-)